MDKFSVLLKAYSEWFRSLKFVDKLLPFALHITFISLGVKFVQDVLWAVFSFSPGLLDTADTLAYFGFLLGIWLLLSTEKEISYVPYALWGYAFVLLFPFNYFGLYTVIYTVIYSIIGYYLMKFIREYKKLDLPDLQKDFNKMKDQYGKKLSEKTTEKSAKKEEDVKENIEEENDANEEVNTEVKEEVNVEEKEQSKD